MAYNICVIVVQKEKERENERKKKLNDVFDFLKQLKSKNKLKLTIREFQKEIILFFGIVDFRAIESKMRLMSTLDLIENKTIRLGQREIWIKK